MMCMEEDGLSWRWGRKIGEGIFSSDIDTVVVDPRSCGAKVVVRRSFRVVVY